LGDECVVQDDVIHRSRPDQQRIGRVRRSLIAVTAAFNAKPKPVLVGEVDGSHHIGRCFGRNGIDAWFRYPCVYPANGLRSSGLIADIVRIPQSRELGLAFGAVWVCAVGEQWFYFDDTAADVMVQPFPACHTRPRRIGRANASKDAGFRCTLGR
jgi:hypothetical protein